MKTIKRFKCLLVWAVFSILSGCANTLQPTQPDFKLYSLVAPGVIDINQFRVVTQTHWSQQIAGNSVSWTKDGVLLNEIVFGEVNEGEDILGRSDRKNSAFNFDSDMPLVSLVELFVDALSLANFHNITLLSEQAKAHNAIRFELSYDKNSNVNYTAMAILMKRNNTLFTLYSSAPSGHLFHTIKPAFNEILESAEVLP